MEKNNTLTIVTPSFNQGQFIEQTIKSVLNQTGDFYIDYIIADGGSTDQTVEIIKKYDELLKKGLYPIKCNGIEFRWWSKKDKGQSSAINQGFKIAKGDILAWINSDDFYEPGAFEYIANKYTKNPEVDLFYGNIYIINKDNKKNSKKTQQGNFNDLATFTGKDLYIYQPSTFFTKRVIRKIGLLDESLHCAMDYDLWIMILKESPILYVDKILANFRIWENSKTSSRQKKFTEEKKIIRKKYGLNIVDKKLIKKITNSFLPSFLRKKNPAFYNFLKTNFYNIANKIKYKRD